MQQPLPLDVAVANRFISSLSKSLQALCHGCMDFENGIEIVGFINVNIDSGSKVDYVLNEKVQKSTNNSMTFVSNSFLAKKDQPKQTKDGSCSPVPELNTFESSQNSSSYQHSQHRPANTYTTQSQNPHGTQKRSWSGMERQWRGSPRKQFRGGSFSMNEGQSYGNNYTSSSSAPSSFPLQSFQTSQKQGEVQDCNSALNVKQEAVDSEFLCDADTPKESVNIKSDPDANPGTNSVCGQPDNDNFLHKSSKASQDQPDPHAPGDLPGSFTADNQHESSESVDNGSQSYRSEAGPSNQTQSSSEPDYNQTEYEDHGEESADVIEIDDDDEDIKAMFGHSNIRFPRPSAEHPQQAAPGQYSHPARPEWSGSAASSLKCTICDKQLQTQSGFNLHLQSHGERKFLCNFCTSKFKFKHHLKGHLWSVHHTVLCPNCSASFTSKQELNQHILRCS